MTIPENADFLCCPYKNLDTNYEPLFTAFMHFAEIRRSRHHEASFRTAPKTALVPGTDNKPCYAISLLYKKDERDADDNISYTRYFLVYKSAQSVPEELVFWEVNIADFSGYTSHQETVGLGTRKYRCGVHGKFYEVLLSEEKKGKLKDGGGWEEDVG